MGERLEIITADGARLAGTVYRPAETPLAGVLVAGAMATPQSHYAAFADWLAQQGLLVLTFDYRGTHASGGERVAAIPASFDIWGQQDVSAAARCLHAQAGARLPLLYLGHSLGGQLFASCTEQALFRRALVVATGSGYWPRLRRPVQRWGLFLVSQVWGPLLTPLFGYFPGRRLGKVGDIPAGVLRQWTHWCRHPDYLARDADQRERFARVTTPITYLNASDDEVFSDWSAQRFLDLFPAGTVTRRLVLQPHALGVARIGHFGYFRDKLRATLWPRLRGELLA